MIGLSDVSPAFNHDFKSMTETSVSAPVKQIWHMGLLTIKHYIFEDTCIYLVLMLKKNSREYLHSTEQKFKLWIFQCDYPLL